MRKSTDCMCRWTHVSDSRMAVDASSVIANGGGLKDENTSLLAKVNAQGSQSTISEDLSGKQKPVEDAQSMGLPPPIVSLISMLMEMETTGYWGLMVLGFDVPLSESKLTTLDILDEFYRQSPSDNGKDAEPYFWASDVVEAG